MAVGYIVDNSYCKKIVRIKDYITKTLIYVINAVTLFEIAYYYAFEKIRY